LAGLGWALPMVPRTVFLAGGLAAALAFAGSGSVLLAALALPPITPRTCGVGWTASSVSESPALGGVLGGAESKAESDESESVSTTRALGAGFCRFGNGALLLGADVDGSAGVCGAVGLSVNSQD
jgi:hypothetical protein